MSSQGFDYWFQWQVPICALIFIIPAIVALNYVKKTKQQPLRSFDLWNPCWRNLNPIWLLLYRAFAFVSMAWMLFEMVRVSGLFVFYFYTQWTFALVMLYFALGTGISAHGCWMSTKTSPSEDWVKEEEYKDKIKTCAGASFLTDLVFWFFLVPLLANVQFELTLLIGAIHTVNAVFLIGDAALNGLPFTWFGFSYFVIWSSIYITFQWIVHAFGFMKWWPYPFLELNTPWAPLWYFGMALFHVPCYAIYAMIVKAKNFFLPKMFPRAFVRLN